MGCALFVLDGPMERSFNLYSFILYIFKYTTRCSFPSCIQGGWMCHPPHAGFLSPPSHFMTTSESYSSDLGL